MGGNRRYGKEDEKRRETVCFIDGKPLAGLDVRLVFGAAVEENTLEAFPPRRSFLY